MDYKVQKNSQNNDMASLVNDVCNILVSISFSLTYKL